MTATPPSPPSPPADPPTSPTRVDRDLATVTLHGLLAGLCPLIPIPFLDDVVLRRVRRSLGVELTKGLPLQRDQVVHLAGASQRPLGCADLAIAPLRLALKLALKIFRRLTIVLSIKESLDTASRLIHEGWLLRAARQRGDLERYRVEAVRAAIETACAAIDPRPLEQLLKRALHGSRKVLRRSTRILVNTAQKPDGSVPLAAEQQELGPLVDRVSRLLADDKNGYFARLEQLYEVALAPPAHQNPGTDVPGS